MRTLTNQVLSFIQRVTSKPITAEVGRSIRTAYDTDEERASICVTFPNNLLFEVSWEYGAHSGADIFTEAQLRSFESHADDLFNAFQEFEKAKTEEAANH